MYLVFNDNKKVRIERIQDLSEIYKRSNKLIKQGKTTHICNDIATVNEVVQNIKEGIANG